MGSSPLELVFKRWKYVIYHEERLCSRVRIDMFGWGWPPTFTSGG